MHTPNAVEGRLHALRSPLSAASGPSPPPELSRRMLDYERTAADVGARARLAFLRVISSPERAAQPQARPARPRRRGARASRSSSACPGALRPARRRCATASCTSCRSDAWRSSPRRARRDGVLRGRRRADVRTAACFAGLLLSRPVPGGAREREGVQLRPPGRDGPRRHRAGARSRNAAGGSALSAPAAPPHARARSAWWT